MNKSEVVHELAKCHADNMTPRQLYSFCNQLEHDTPMSVIVEAIEQYFWDSIDEVDYTHVLQEFPV